jgi:hypothetical protein
MEKTLSFIGYLEKRKCIGEFLDRESGSLELLAMSVDDTTTREIVWRHFNPDSITQQDADVILAHLS